MWTLAGVGYAEPPLRLLIEQVTHQGAHIHIRLINEGRAPVRLFLGSDPFGAQPFEFSMDGDFVPIAAEHRHDGKSAPLTLNPGNHYLVEIGSEQQFIGHTLVARYKVAPDDIKRCKACWIGTLESTPLRVTAK